jgi:predicted neutral ceramidase superfamily lipid hydrolase
MVMMSNSNQLDKTERAEFWGTTPASLLAASGFLVSVLSSLYLQNKWLSFYLAILGIGALILSLWINWRKGLDVKWRKVNFCLHALLLLVSALAIIIRLLYGRLF